MQKFRNVGHIVVRLNSSLAGVHSDDNGQPVSDDRYELVHELFSDPQMGMGRKYRIASKICDLIVQNSATKFCLSLPDLYSFILLKEWLLARREAKQHHSSSMKGEHASEHRTVVDDKQLLADCYLEYWLRQGVNCERYYLIKARDHYKAALDSSDTKNSKDMTDRMRRSSVSIPTDFTHHINYCRVLQYLGEFETASKFLADNVLRLSVDDPEYPNHLFCAGVIQKAMNNFDEANEKFFEASQVGPPRFFSKVEMMILISRTIEEKGAADGEEGEDDAYRMVFDNLKLEGQVEEDAEYEDWISLSETWLELGDKCAIHQLFSLATDFYGRSILKDQDAFKKPMLWYKFAKSCYRCGRTSDAQLAIKQALAKAPHNIQLLRANRSWSRTLPDPVTKTAVGDLESILETLAPQVDRRHLVHTRMQATFRGIQERYNMLLGIGSRTDVNKRMTAKVGILLNDQIPIILRVKPSWMGKITNLRIYDIRKNTYGIIRLKTPFAPMKERNTPRRLQLTLECLKEKVLVRMRVGEDLSSTNNSSYQDLTHSSQGSRRFHTPAMPSEIENELFGQPVDTDTTPYKPAPMFGGGNHSAAYHSIADNDTAAKRENEEEFEYIEEEITQLIFKFTDLDTGEFSYRRMKLKINLDLLYGEEDGSNPLMSHPSLDVDDLSKDELTAVKQAEITKLRQGLAARNRIKFSDSAKIRSDKITSSKTASGIEESFGLDTDLPDIDVAPHSRGRSSESSKSDAVSIKAPSTKGHQGLGMMNSPINTMESPSSRGPRFSVDSNGRRNSTAPNTPSRYERGTRSALDLIHVMEEEEDSNIVTVTNIVTMELMSAVYHFRNEYFLIRVFNDQDVTTVTMLQFHSDLQFIFLMVREHIDRAMNMTKSWALLCRIIEQNPLLKSLMNRQTITQTMFDSIENPCYMDNIHVFVNIMPNNAGATVILVNPESRPLLGHSFEVLHHADMMATPSITEATDIDNEEDEEDEEVFPLPVSPSHNNRLPTPSNKPFSPPSILEGKIETDPMDDSNRRNSSTDTSGRGTRQSTADGADSDSGMESDGGRRLSKRSKSMVPVRRPSMADFMGGNFKSNRSFSATGGDGSGEILFKFSPLSSPKSRERPDATQREYIHFPVPDDPPATAESIMFGDEFTIGDSQSVSGGDSAVSMESLLERERQHQQRSAVTFQDAPFAPPTTYENSFVSSFAGSVSGDTPDESTHVDTAEDVLQRALDQALLEQWENDQRLAFERSQRETEIKADIDNFAGEALILSEDSLLDEEVEVAVAILSAETVDAELMAATLEEEIDAVAADMLDYDLLPDLLDIILDDCIGKHIRHVQHDAEKERRTMMHERKKMRNNDVRLPEPIVYKISPAPVKLKLAELSKVTQALHSSPKNIITSPMNAITSVTSAAIAEDEEEQSPREEYICEHIAFQPRGVMLRTAVGNALAGTALGASNVLLSKSLPRDPFVFSPQNMKHIRRQPVAKPNFNRHQYKLTLPSQYNTANELKQALQDHEQDLTPPNEPRSQLDHNLGYFSMSEDDFDDEDDASHAMNYDLDKLEHMSSPHGRHHRGFNHTMPNNRRNSDNISLGSRSIASKSNMSQMTGATGRSNKSGSSASIVHSVYADHGELYPGAKTNKYVTKSPHKSLLRDSNNLLRTNTRSIQALDPIEAQQADNSIIRDHIYKESLQSYHRLGYVDSRQPLAYNTHWKAKLTAYLATFESTRPLKKKLTTLKRTAPIQLTMDEAICALAGTNGSVGEVVEKLKNLEYYSEIRLVCASLHIKSMVLAMQDGDDLFTRSRVSSRASVADVVDLKKSKTAPEIRNRGGGEGLGRGDFSEEGSDAGGNYRALTAEHITQQSPYQIRQQKKQMAAYLAHQQKQNHSDDDNSSLTSVGSNHSLNSFMSASAMSGMDFTHDSQIHGNENPVKRKLKLKSTSQSTLKLPHMNLNADSLLVQRNASVVSLSSLSSGTTSPAKLSRHGSSNSASGLGVPHAGLANTLGKKASTKYLPTLTSSMETAQTQLQTQRPAGDYFTNSQNNEPFMAGQHSVGGRTHRTHSRQVSYSDVVSPGNNNLEEYGSEEGEGDGVTTRLTATPNSSSEHNISKLARGGTQRKSFFGASNRSLKKEQSFRLDHNISGLMDENADLPITILCRRDALKAQQEETLLKSDKVYIRQHVTHKMKKVRREPREGEVRANNGQM